MGAVGDSTLSSSVRPTWGTLFLGPGNRPGTGARKRRIPLEQEVRGEHDQGVLSRGRTRSVSRGGVEGFLRVEFTWAERKVEVTDEGLDSREKGESSEGPARCYGHSAQLRATLSIKSVGSRDST